MAKINTNTQTLTHTYDFLNDNNWIYNTYFEWCRPQSILLGQRFASIHVTWNGMQFFGECLALTISKFQIKARMWMYKFGSMTAIKERHANMKRLWKFTIFPNFLDYFFEIELLAIKWLPNFKISLSTASILCGDHSVCLRKAIVIAVEIIGLSWHWKSDNCLYACNILFDD